MSGDLTAREAMLKALYAHPQGDSVTVDAVLAALAAAGWRLESDDQWEWGERWPDGTVRRVFLAGESRNLSDEGNWFARRRPAGEWEVAPDA